MDKDRFKLQVDHCIWVMANPAIFKGNARPSKDQQFYIYNMYNEIFSASKKPNGCGACLRNTIDSIYKVTEKYCDELCQKKQEAQETQSGTKDSQAQTLTEGQSAPKTRRRKKSE